MFGIRLDHDANVSITRQLCGHFRTLIERGVLKEGDGLPASRKLASELAIARNTVIEVYEQLIAEGYLESRVGSGTFVAGGIRPLLAPMNDGESGDDLVFDSQANASGGDRDIVDFVAGVPDLSLFPRRYWSKCLKTAIEQSADDVFDYGDIKGDARLRSSICDYLFRMKGMRCHPDQAMIVSGTTEGFLLIAKAMADDFHSVYVEDPTVEFGRDIFRHMNYRLVPLDVDASGMRLDTLERFERGHLALVTPSHQLPLGSILSVQRRQKAIQMADAADVYLIEDDYDSEFRLKGVPVPPLFTLNPSRVIYVGTFSKTLSPGLRIGFVIVPRHMVEVFARVKNELNLRTSTVQQRALHYFIEDGYLDHHIRHMKSIYKKRRNALVDRLKHTFGSNVVIMGDEVGMHLMIDLSGETYGRIDWSDTASYGFKACATSAFFMDPGDRYTNGLVLGYGNLTPDVIAKGVDRLHRYVTERGGRKETIV